MTGPSVSAENHGRRALLLDFDGTLANTLPGLRGVYADFLRGLDAVGMAPSFEQANGANLFQLIKGICQEYAPDRDADQEWQSYWNSVETAVLKSLPAAGAHQIVTWAREQGWLIGIGSASRTGLMSSWLVRNELAPYVDCIIGADLCERGKPDAAIYRLLVATLCVDTQDCIVIEDSPSGVESASRAGLDVIRLTAASDSSGSQFATCHQAADLLAALEYLQRRFEPMREH